MILQGKLPRTIIFSSIYVFGKVMNLYLILIPPSQVAPSHPIEKNRLNSTMSPRPPWFSFEPVPDVFFFFTVIEIGGPERRV